MPLDRPVKPGDPLRIPADVYNRLIRNLNEKATPPKTFNKPNHSLVTVQGSFEKGIYQPVSIDTTVIGVSSGYVDVLEYNEAYHYPHLWVVDEVEEPIWVVLLEHLNENQPARALVNGLTWCWVDVLDTDHKYVTPNANNDGLETTNNPTRACIYTIPSGSTGEHYILIHLGSGGGGSSTRIAICNPAIPARSGSSLETIGSGTAYFVDYDDLSQIGVANESFTCYNIYDKSVPANCPFLVHKHQDSGLWLNERPAIIDLRLDGVNLQYRRSCAWETWLVGQRCTTDSSGSSSP